MGNVTDKQACVDKSFAQVDDYIKGCGSCPDTVKQYFIKKSWCRPGTGHCPVYGI